MLFCFSIHYRLTGDRDQTCCKERSVISKLALNNPDARQFRDYWTFTGSQKPRPRSALCASRSDSIVVCLSAIAGLVITRRYRLVTRINITTPAFGQGVISKSFSLYLICRKNIFFCRFSEYFFRFLSCFLVALLVYF